MKTIMDKLNELNLILVKWNQTDKSQRFGQFVSNNSDIKVSQDLYNSNDSYGVYSEIVTMFENEELCK